MPAVTDRPPVDVAAELAALAAALDQKVPAKVVDRNLLLATWNIRVFGGLTDAWRSRPDDSPKRDLASVRCIAEILSRFDVVAVQEVRDHLKALRHVLKVLGPEWGMILTDVTKGPRGNGERLAFLYDTRRAKPSGLAGELVLPDRVAPGEEGEPSPVRQFARTPYAVSFAAGRETFILTTMHVLYGSEPAERVPELLAIAEWLADWARRERSWGHNLLTLGDFNIDRRSDPLYQAFTSTGLTPPAQLNDTRRTIFDDGPEGHFYDQIAWFTGAHGVPQLSLQFSGQAGGFDFVPHVMTSLTRTELSWRLSDHYPLWVEFAMRH